MLCRIAAVLKVKYSRRCSSETREVLNWSNSSRWLSTSLRSFRVPIKLFIKFIFESFCLTRRSNFFELVCMAVVMVAFVICFLTPSCPVGVDTRALSADSSDICGGASLVTTFYMSSTATGDMEVLLSESGGEIAGTTKEVRVVESITLSIGLVKEKRADWVERYWFTLALACTIIYQWCWVRSHR